MLRIQIALSNRRYWGRMRAVHAENTLCIDTEEKLRELRSLHSDADVLLHKLAREGVAIVPGYWSKDDCAVASAEIDRLISQYPDAVRLFSGGSDKRIFGVEMVSESLARFHNDPFLKGVGEVLGGLELYNFATLGARIDATTANNGSGDGWHRDSFGFQYKSIIYLSDVADTNGPFEFLPGSHLRWRVAIDTALGGLPEAPQSRLDPDIVDKLVSRAHVPRRRYPAPQGTLILANVGGIHRGAPLVSGTRYALTNYYYHPYQIGESLIEKFSPMIPGRGERVLGDLAGRVRGHTGG
jgi:hypothetical protein